MPDLPDVTLYDVDAVTVREVVVTVYLADLVRQMSCVRPYGRPRSLAERDSCSVVLSKGRKVNMTRDGRHYRKPLPVL